MCGIAGIISRAPITEGDRALVDRMNAALLHRGPNSAGAYQHGHLAMAMRRLSIIDLAGGSQPLFNEDGSIALVANGEVYNFVELRAELEARGHRFATHSDCETIVHAYEEYGDAFVARLRGMFAFCLYDVKRGRAIVGRDRLGEKPVYVYRTDDRIAFSSELKSLVELIPRDDRRVSLDAVELFFRLEYVPEPLTMLEGVTKLPKAGMLVVDTATFRAEERIYWSMLDVAPADGEPRAVVREALDDVGRIIIRSDVPVGVSLSGGIDSSVIALLARAHTDHPIHAFSVGYPGYPANDERGLARDLAERLSMEFHDIEITRDEFLRDFDAVVYAMDDPLADIAAYGYYRVSEAAREAGVPVLFAGFGGDELFWGYPMARASVDFNRMRRGLLGRMRFFRALLKRHPVALRTQPWWLLRYALSKAFGNDYLMYEFHPSYFQALRRRDAAFTPAFRRATRHAWERVASPSAREPDVEIATCALLFDYWIAGNCIPLGDRLSMAHSVEMRLPLLDYELVERVFALRRARGGDHELAQKAWLVDAMRDQLPADIAERKKLGFTPPTSDWIETVVAAHRERVLDGWLVANDVLSRDYVKRALGDVHANREFLYRALVLETWLAQYVTGALDAPAPNALAAARA
jgi:asparagine synthase (glutamine-hydrolysing)